MGPVASRWLVSGHVSYNAKQEPVRRFEPFYSTTPHYEPEGELATFGAVHVRLTRSAGAFGMTLRTRRSTGPNTDAGPSRGMTPMTRCSTPLPPAARGLPVDDPERVAYERAAEHTNTRSRLCSTRSGTKWCRWHALHPETPTWSRRLGWTLPGVRWSSSTLGARHVPGRQGHGRGRRHESIDAGTEVVLHDAFDRPVRRWMPGAHTWLPCSTR
jgi:hypothetical protein